MNANAAILDNDHLAAIEREEAEKLAPEIVRDLQKMAADQEAIADKLPAELASISEMFSAMVERKAEIARKAADDIAEVDAQMLRTLNQALRRLAVTENLLNMERQTTVNLRDAAEYRANVIRAALAGIDDATDQALIAKRATEDYERNYREQYEHAPEPPDDDSGSQAPVTQRDREITEALDDGLTDLVNRMKRHGSGQVSAPSLRARIMNTGRAMLNPEQFIRRDASPPYVRIA